MDLAPIVETFVSIQGEGKGLGRPSLFVRFFGCNLRCNFNGKNCDTPYSVFDKDKNSNEMTSNEIASIINNSKVKHVVYTGGEPLMYQNFIVEVMKNVNKGYTAEVETNGTIPIETLQLVDYIDWFNVSLKLKSSNQPEGFEMKRINQRALSSFPPYKRYFKFVVSQEEDMEEILAMVSDHNWPTYLMPEGVDRETIIKNSPMVVDLCIKHGFLFSPREHITIWDTLKGK